MTPQDTMLLRRRFFTAITELAILRSKSHHLTLVTFPILGDFLEMYFPTLPLPGGGTGKKSRKVWYKILMAEKIYLPIQFFPIIEYFLQQGADWSARGPLDYLQNTRRLQGSAYNYRNVFTG